MLMQQFASRGSTYNTTIKRTLVTVESEEWAVGGHRRVWTLVNCTEMLYMSQDSV